MTPREEWVSVARQHRREELARLFSEGATDDEREDAARLVGVWTQVISSFERDQSHLVATGGMSR